jgi:hypothetical protein
LIYATELLNNRIDEIRKLRAEYGLDDDSPTLNDLEKTHILFLNAHFKPFIAFGFEYLRTQTNSGTIGLQGTAGQTQQLKFSIPMFGDFFSDMAFYVKLGAVQNTDSYKLVALPAPVWEVYSAAGALLFSVAEGELRDAVTAITVNNSHVAKLAVLLDLGSRQDLEVRVQKVGAVGYDRKKPWAGALGTLVDNADVFDAAGLLGVANGGVDVVEGSSARVANGAHNVNVLGNSQFNSEGLVCKVKWTSDYVDASGKAVPIDQTLTTESGWAPWLRYAEWPGHRMLREVIFSVNNNILDEYDNEVYNFFEKLFLCENKRTGYSRLVGHEVPEQARRFVNNEGVVEVTQVSEGLQVPKPSLPPANFWIPLLFWFSRDFRLSIPSISIPYGQRFIDIRLSSIKDLVYVEPANVFKLTHVRTLLQSEKNFANNGAEKKELHERQATVLLTDYSKSEATGVKFDQIDIDLYINNIFVNSEIHDIYIKRVGFTLVRVFRQQTLSLNNSTSDQLLNELKWPIEYMCIGMRPTAPVNYNNDPERWHRYTYVEPKMLKQFDVTSADSGVVDGSLRWLKETPLLTTFGVRAHGVKIYNDDFPAELYSTYLPWRYSGNHMVTPKDKGVYLVPFCLYPGEYQPSGHFNISRAREFYLKYKSDILGSATGPTVSAADMHIVASALNFLLISDGSAILRYST